MKYIYLLLITAFTMCMLQMKVSDDYAAIKLKEMAVKVDSVAAVHLDRDWHIPSTGRSGLGSVAFAVLIAIILFKRNIWLYILSTIYIMLLHVGVFNFMLNIKRGLSVWHIGKAGFDGFFNSELFYWAFMLITVSLCLIMLFSVIKYEKRKNC